MYQLAEAAEPGVLIDVGPAQGGTSVSIALGIKASGKPSKLYSVDRFYGSRALQWMKRENLEDNINVIKNNLKSYEVDHLVEVIPGRIDDVVEKISSDQPISMVSIDADGCLDRDFDLLYERMLPGAPVVLDDYSDTINSHGNKLLEISDDEIEQYEARSKKSGKWNESESLRDFTPLGKNYSIYQFVQYLMEVECLIETHQLGNVWIGKISESKPELNRTGMQQVREDIYQKYLSMRSAV